MAPPVNDVFLENRVLEGHRDPLLHERRGLLSFAGSYQVRRAQFVVLSPSSPVRQIFHRLVEFCFCSDRLARGWSGVGRRTPQQENGCWSADQTADKNSPGLCHQFLRETFEHLSTPFHELIRSARSCGVTPGRFRDLPARNSSSPQISPT